MEVEGHGEVAEVNLIEEIEDSRIRQDKNRSPETMPMVDGRLYRPVYVGVRQKPVLGQEQQQQRGYRTAAEGSPVQ